MIWLKLVNWSLSAGIDTPANRMDNETVEVRLVGDIPEGYQWELLIAHEEYLDVIHLDADGDEYRTLLTAEQLAFDGDYEMQLRAFSDYAVKHSTKTVVRIGETISGDERWPDVPTVFTQALDRAEAALEHAESIIEDGVTPIGEWNEDADYDRLDVVSHDAGSYIARQDVPAGTALTEEEYWMPLANTAEAIARWLEAHPEATTTVQDGSITRQKLHQALAQEITKHGTDIDVLDSRVDEILGLTPGSTTGDAQLADIKIGWDGRTYATPGDAVRGQAADVSEKTANTWYLRDVEVSPDTYTSYPIRNISGSWPAGTYTIVATVDSEYTGNPIIALMNGNSQLQWKEFRNHARSAVTFTIDSDANRVRFYVGRTTSTTLLGLTAWWRDVMLIEGEHTDTEYIPPVTARDDVARKSIDDAVDELSERIDDLEYGTINIWTGERNYSGTGYVTVNTGISAGTYTIVATAQSDAAHPQVEFRNANGYEVAWANFDSGSRSAVTVTIPEDFTKVRFAAAATVSGSKGKAFAYTDIMLIEGAYDDTTYIPPQSAIDAEARAGVIALDGRITALENGGKLPDYWLDHIEEKCVAINRRIAAAGGYGSSFVFITDIHDYNKGWSPALIDYVKNHTPINRMIMGGDYADDADSKEAFLAKLNEHLNRYKTLGMVTNIIVGNHEYNDQGTHQPDLRLSSNNLAGILLTGQNNIVRSDSVREAPAFYFDDETQKIRFFVASVTYSSGYSTGSWRWIFTQLLSVPAGYTVIILCHHLMADSGSAATMWQYAADAANAVRNRTAVTMGYPINRTYNYSNVADYNIAIALCGDRHKDGVASRDGLMTLRTTCDKFEDSDGYGMVSGTDTEQAFDVITLDIGSETEAHPIGMTAYITRIGRGFDRIVHYNPQILSSSLTLTTDIADAVWVSDDETVATVEDGVVTKVGTGAVVIHADGETEKEFWNIMAVAT